MATKIRLWPQTFSQATRLRAEWKIFFFSEQFSYRKSTFRFENICEALTRTLKCKFSSHQNWARVVRSLLMILKLVCIQLFQPFPGARSQEGKSGQTSLGTGPLDNDATADPFRKKTIRLQVGRPLDKREKTGLSLNQICLFASRSLTETLVSDFVTGHF